MQVHWLSSTVFDTLYYKMRTEDFEMFNQLTYKARTQIENNRVKLWINGQKAYLHA